MRFGSLVGSIVRVVLVACAVPVGWAGAAEATTLPSTLEVDPALVVDPIPWIAFDGDGPAVASGAATDADIEAMKWRGLGGEAERIAEASRLGSAGTKATPTIVRERSQMVGGTPEGMRMDWQDASYRYRAILAVRILESRAGVRGLLPSSLSRVEIVEVIKGEEGWQPRELRVLTWEGRARVGDLVIELGHPEEPIRAGEEMLLFVPMWQRNGTSTEPLLEQGLVVVERFDFVTRSTLFPDGSGAARGGALLDWVLEGLRAMPEAYFARLGWWFEHLGSDG